MVFQHLIVPLDGSRLAEAALPAAAHLAQTLNARVTLLHVIERDAPQEVHGQRHLSDRDEALTYLQEMSRRSFPAQVQVDQAVPSAEAQDVAESLTEQVEKLHGDLIVMCAHGRGGLNIRLIGSLPQRIIMQGITPVLLIPPLAAEQPAPFSCRRLIAPVDGDPDHEQGLPIAAALARVCGASLHLILVVHTLRSLPAERAAAATLLPAATSEFLEMSRQAAESYLRRLASTLRTGGIRVTTDVLRGDPAEVIIQAARELQADLIVIGTHGKIGMDAFWADSLTPKITSNSRFPLLLVPVR